MKYHLLFLPLFCLMCNQGSRADPFYAENNEVLQAEQNNKNFAKNPPKLPACIPPDARSKIEINTPFQQLKLVGIAQFNSKFKAIFLDEQNRVLDFEAGDFIEQDNIEIKTISLKSVQYIDWLKNQNCQNPSVIHLKL